MQKNNPIQEKNPEILGIEKEAKELGINLHIYNGETGNIHIGLADANNIYLDANIEYGLLEEITYPLAISLDDTITELKLKKVL